MLPQRLLQHSALIAKIAIGVCVLWSILMLVMFWMSGAEETKRAFKMGQRFIINITDGSVQGHHSLGTNEEKKAEVAPAEVVATPAVEENIDEDIVKKVSAIASSSPITEVNPELVEKNEKLSLPRISDAGLQPRIYYMKSFRRQNEMPLVAIVITGLGLSHSTTEMALAMDDKIGLSFSPYAQAINSWAAASRVAGHEMYLDLPMQLTSYPASDPGPYSLLITRTNADNLKYLQWVMSRFQGYVGVVAPMNEVITANNDTFQPLAKEIAKRGVMMLSQRNRAVPTKDKAKAEEEKGAKLALLDTDVWLDEELSEMSIQARLATLEQTAHRNGFAIGIAGAYPLTIKQIQYWQQTMADRGIVLAPVSFITKLKY